MFPNVVINNAFGLSPGLIGRGADRAEQKGVHELVDPRGLFERREVATPSSTVKDASGIEPAMARVSATGKVASFRA